jgi:ATP-dependent protease ClpP protease subunit
MKRIILEGEFGWEITSKNILPLLDEANGEDLDVHIASPGGSVFKGIKVYNDFRDYKRKFPKTQNMLTIKSIAASMASHFAMNPAFDLVAVEDNVTFMMHNITGGVYGDYRDGEKWLEIVKGLTSLLVLAYTEKTGKSKKEIRKMMDDETWFFGANIVKAGFADEIIKTDDKKNEEESVAYAKLQYQETEKKLKTLEIEDNEIQELAAFFDIENSDSNKQDKNEHPPADDAGKNNRGGLVMTLEEFKAQHPALYEEIFNEGIKAGKKEILDIGNKVEKFIGNPEFPKHISDTAISVFKGEKSVDVLDMLIATVDMTKEIQKSNAAAGENPPPTPGDQNQAGQVSKEYQESGMIMNVADMAAEEKRMKTMLGQEVN